MKAKSFLVLICLAFNIIQSQAQNGVNRTQPTQKGYYSFGNHAARLQLEPASQFRLAATREAVRPAKGFYSIAENHRSLGKQTALIPPQKRRPVISKGYYSIGNNAEKLAR